MIMAWIFLHTGQGAHGSQAFAVIMGVSVAVAAVVLWRAGLDLGRPRSVAPVPALSLPGTAS